MPSCSRVATFRTADQRTRQSRHWPRVVALVDADLRPDPASTARLLDLAADADISVIWLAPTAAAVPRQASRIVRVEHGDGARMDGLVWSTDPSVPERMVEVEHLRHCVAERAARSLAPVRDASTASLATSIPRTAPLLDVLGPDEITGGQIVERWLHHSPQYSAGAAEQRHQLRFPIGLAADGPLVVDLVSDGPHTLIGGTSGAGKSELLQSMVASLAANHSPERLNFLFVDYKGGASSQMFERLPHTVGYVTNLSADLSVRALTSLRAELDRRMALMEGRAKDLEEMLERHPDDAPAALVIVVDEFATLVKEVPEFVAGVVDIAQRGRSLGIHLVLATQRPSGSVNENILANTNLRISLRVLDRSESTAILDSPDAADIPVPLRGRGLVRLGPRQLVEFQSSFAGAQLQRDEERHPVRVGPFDRPDAAPVNAVAAGRHGSTHLDVVLAAIVSANESLGARAPRRPWRDVLPEVITLDTVWSSIADRSDDIDAGRHVVIGMLDRPEAQDQRPAVVDLEESGGMLIHGSGGTGKTTALRTIAAAIDRANRRIAGTSGSAATIVFDFASRGLTQLRLLPSVIDVVTGDDLEGVTRHLLRLDAELDRRRRLLAARGSEHLERVPSRPSRRGARSNRRADRRFRRSRRRAARRRRLVRVGRCREMGGDRAAHPRRRPSGRDPRCDHDRSAQRRAAEAPVVDRCSADPPTRRSAVVCRPRCGRRRSVRSRSGDRPGAPRRPRDRADRVGVARSIGPIAIRHDRCDRVRRRSPCTTPTRQRCLTRDGHRPSPRWCSRRSRRRGCRRRRVRHLTRPRGHRRRVVARHGRRTVPLRSLDGARGIRARSAAGRCPRRRYVVGPASSPLASLGLPEARSAFGRAEVVGALIDRVANLAAVAAADERIVLVVDDLDALDDACLTPVWDRLVATDSIRIVAALETRSMVGYTTNAAVMELRRARRTLVLQPDDPSEFLQLTGVKLPTRPGLAMVPGRGVLLVDRQPSIVQIAQRASRAVATRTPAPA